MSHVRKGYEKFTFSSTLSGSKCCAKRKFERVYSCPGNNKVLELSRFISSINLYISVPVDSKNFPLISFYFGVQVRTKKKVSKNLLLQ